MSRRELLRELAQRIQEIESGDRSRGRPAAAGIPALEGILPDGRLPAGALVELLAAAAGAGAGTLALLLAKHACGKHKALVIVDAEKSFYPPAAARLGVDLRRTIVVHSAARRDALAALDQSLRCPAVGAVLGWCARLSTMEFRRLQLAAEAGGGAGFLLRPGQATREPSFATLRLRIAPVPSAEIVRRIQVEVLRCQGGRTGQSLILEIDDEAGDVRLPAPLAAPAPAARAARASG